MAIAECNDGSKGDADDGDGARALYSLSINCISSTAVVGRVLIYASVCTYIYVCICDCLHCVCEHDVHVCINGFCSW